MALNNDTSLDITWPGGLCLLDFETISINSSPPDDAQCNIEDAPPFCNDKANNIKNTCIDVLVPTIIGVIGLLLIPNIKKEFEAVDPTPGLATISVMLLSAMLIMLDTSYQCIQGNIMPYDQRMHWFCYSYFTNL